jgi:hypothetical protein
MSKQGVGFGRGQKATQPATSAAKAIKRASAGNVQVVAGTTARPHDSRSGIDKAVSATRKLAPSSRGGITPVTGQGMPSARAPQRAR